MTGVGTLALALVTVFQDRFRTLLSRPKLTVSITAKPPDCTAATARVLIPPDQHHPAGRALEVRAMFARLLVKNEGNAAALNVEVYGEALRRKGSDAWESVGTFPSMNFRWAHIVQIYFPRIAPNMGKHCDIVQVSSPSRLRQLPEQPQLPAGLDADKTAIKFLLFVDPFNKANIFGPGLYQLDLKIAAENAKPIMRTLEVELTGVWRESETEMLRDGLLIHRLF